MIHARAWLALRLGRIDGHLEKTSAAHHLGELPELRGGPGRFAQQLCFGQTGFQGGPNGQRLGDGLQVVGDTLQQGRTLGERGVAVVVERGVGEDRRLVHFSGATEGELRLDKLMGGGVQRLHRPCAGGDFVGADQQVSSQFHGVLTA
ncbi:hypothetical protein D3C76_530510 [compost metagenome]